MNRKTSIVTGFVVLALIQIAVPLFMIARREATLRNGAQYKFRTAPVDPADAFRGRYVALRFEQAEVPVPRNSDYKRGERLYAALALQPDGFARIADLSRSRPATNAYLKVGIQYVNERGNWQNVTNANGAVRNDFQYSNTVASLELPFDRYYMNEKQAPQAERAYWDNNRRTNRNAYVTVRVKRGSAVLENLYIGDQPVEEFIRK